MLYLTLNSRTIRRKNLYKGAKLQVRAHVNQIRRNNLYKGKKLQV